MAVAICGACYFFEQQGTVYTSPTNCKSLSQWLCLFRDVRLIAPRGSAGLSTTGWEPLPASVKVCGLDVEGLSYFRRRRAVLRQAREYLRDVELLYVRMPDHAVYWTFCVAASLKIPVLLELHGDWESSARVSETYGSPLRIGTKHLRAVLRRTATAKMAVESLAVVTIGPVLAEKYIPSGKPVLVSTNHTVDEKLYCARKTYELNDRPRLLYVGELVKRKGLSYLFGAMGRLKRFGYECELVVAGEGPQRGYLEQYARKHGFFQNVKFAGYVPFGRQLLDHYRGADIFVLPSVGGEGVPRAAHEAMSQGCPVIATDIGSTAWQLQDGAGVVIPPANVDALVDAIIGVIEDGNLRRRLCERGFERSFEFTFEKQSERIAKFVREHLPASLLA